MIIIKRTIALIIDLIIPFLAAFGASLGGLDLITSFGFIYFFSQVFEIIYLREQTLGTKVCKLKPKNLDHSHVNIIKLFFYHILLAIDIVTIFTSITAKASSVLIGVVLIFPMSFNNKCQSLLDLIFRIQWVEIPENNT